jgi:signal transduction histidine kinase
MSGGGASLGRVIRAKRAEIIAASRQGDDAGASAGIAALVDRIAELIEAQNDGALEAAHEVGRMHAANRADSGAALSDVVAELSSLRAAVVGFYEQEQGGDARVDAVAVVDAAIDAAMLGAATHHDALLKRARDAMQQRDDVLALVAHDLGNPLGAVLMAVSSQLSPRAGEEQDESTRKSLQSIHRAALRMRRLVQDLMDLANIDAGRFSVQKLPQAPLSMAEEAIEPFKVDAAKRNIELHVEIGADVPAVSCDRDRIMHVLWNLVGTAMSSSRTGGAIHLHAEPRGQDVLFSVIDAGSGIPAEELPHVFDRNRRSARYKTAGVGLAIARNVLAAHDGRIWVESQPGQGAAFYFTLPLAPA